MIEYKTKKLRSNLFRLPTEGDCFPVIIKKCGCGISYTQSQWESLKCLGIADGLDYRNCSCGSTIAIETHPRDL